MDFMMAEKKLSNDKSLEVNITISRKKKTHFCLKLDLHCFDEKNENEPKNCNPTVCIILLTENMIRIFKNLLTK